MNLYQIWLMCCVYPWWCWWWWKFYGKIDDPLVLSCRFTMFQSDVVIIDTKKSIHNFIDWQICSCWFCQMFIDWYNIVDTVDVYFWNFQFNFCEYPKMHMIILIFLFLNFTHHIFNESLIQILNIQTSNIYLSFFFSKNNNFYFSPQQSFSDLSRSIIFFFLLTFLICDWQTNFCSNICRKKFYRFKKKKTKTSVYCRNLK